MGATKFRRFFRVVAELRVDDDDLKRYSEFVNEKLTDLLIVGQAAAKASGRDVLMLHDLPITKGLQQCIHAFEKLDDEPDLEPLLADIAAIPPVRAELSDEVRARPADCWRIELRDRAHPPDRRPDAEQSDDGGVGTGFRCLQLAVVSKEAFC